MEPYYSDDSVTIYHGDCREVTEWLGGDVMVTDPPYGRAWRQGDTGTARGWVSDRHSGIANDHDTSTRDTILTWWGDRQAVVFGDLMLAPPPHTAHVLVYDKGPSGGFVGATGGWRRNAEAVYLMGRGWSSGLGGDSCILTTVGVSGGNLARIHGHPHAKPEDVCRLLIERSAPGVVLDPFMGSGTTLRVAKDLGRRSIGVEIDERYCEIAARRMGQEVFDFGGAA